MQRLEPLDDLRRDVLELVDQQVAEGRQGLAGSAVALGQHVAQALERAIEGHQPLLLQQGLELRPEAYQGFGEQSLARRAGQLAGFQLPRTQADALHEPGLLVEGLEQRQGSELAGQLETVQRRLGNPLRLALDGSG
ncbi:hypothetical protein D9M70_590570 [compost metagenome]